MNKLNKIRILRVMYPDDTVFTKKLDEFLKASLTCCDKTENHIEKHVEDVGSYGYYGIEIRCKVCNELIKFIEDTND